VFVAQHQVPAKIESGEPSQQITQPATPSISLPKGGGAIRGIGEVAANPLRGTGSLTVPIAHERNRTTQAPSANRCLKRICYGTHVSRLIEPDLSKAKRLLEVVLDHGEQHPDDPKPRDDEVVERDETKSKRLCRHDPFSTYRSGFDRICRRCQRALMFHHFSDEEGWVKIASSGPLILSIGIRAGIRRTRSTATRSPPSSLRSASGIQTEGLWRLSRKAPDFRRSRIQRNHRRRDRR
jgi:virulence plasmid B protein